MTDRWRAALRDLDDLGPDVSVYRRARQGPSHPDVPEVPGRAKRLVAGVTAVAVFALAAGFAWRALRPSGESVAVAPAPGTVVALGEDGSTLWPENTATGLKSAQAEADAGNLAWRLDPEEVATRFANQVLGWNPGNYGIDTTPTSSGQGSVTRVTARLTRYTLPCPAPVNDHMGPMCAGGAEDIALAEPVTTGAGGIWSVVSVTAPTSPAAALEAQPGLVIANDGTSVGSVEGVDLARTMAGSFIGDVEGGGPCEAAGGGSQEGPRVVIDVSVRPDPAAGTDCGPAAPGFVWAGAAVDSERMQLTDPLDGGMVFVSFAAVPIVVSFPENVPTESAGRTEVASALSGYTDPAGWSVSYPSAWSVSPIDIQSRVNIQGVVIANGPGGLASPNAATPGPIGPDLGSASSDLVAVGITATSGGPPGGLPVGDDTPLPLSASDLKVAPGTCTVCPAGMDIQTNGVGYEIALWAGRDASEADVAAARAIIESFQGARLGSGTVTAGWTPLFTPHGGFPKGEATAVVLAGAPELRRLGVMYVMHPASGPIYALDLVPDTCGEGQDQRWDAQTQEIRVTCPDGTVIRFDPEGRPLPGNPAGADRQLEAYPVIRSWDDQFLLGVSEPFLAQPQWTP